MKFNCSEISSSISWLNSSGDSPGSEYCILISSSSIPISFPGSTSGILYLWSFGAIVISEIGEINK